MADDQSVTSAGAFHTPRSLAHNELHEMRKACILMRLAQHHNLGEIKIFLVQVFLCEGVPKHKYETPTAICRHLRTLRSQSDVNRIKFLTASQWINQG